MTEEEKNTLIRLLTLFKQIKIERLALSISTVSSLALAGKIEGKESASIERVEFVLRYIKASRL